ncbi:MAG: neutral/alkaline non-lysosomal ceramidase N-terminal domain-containing protein, partial [Terriglobales bacterium]
MAKKSQTSLKPVRTDLLAGWARCEFAPPQGAPMPGYIARKTVASGQAGPLYVRALVLQKGKVRAALLVADVLLISNRWASRLRARLGKILGVPSNNVIVAATHTHSGPMIDTAPFDLLQTEVPGAPTPSVAMRCIEVCMEQALSAAAKSMHGVKTEMGRVFVRKVATDRNDPARVASQPLYLLRFTARKRRAILGVFGCHSTVLGPDNTLLSGDFLGEISRRLEQDADVALVGAGAAANISTRFTSRGQTFE